MPVLRQFLIVAILAGLAAAGFAWKSGSLPWLGASHSDTAAPTAKGKGRGNRAAPVLVATVSRKTFRQRVEAVGTTRALQSVEIVPSSSGRIRRLSIKSGASVKKGDILARLDDDIQRADLAEANAKRNEVARNLQRAERLFRKRNIAEARVTELRSQQAVADAELARATRRVADRTVRAPFDGRTGMHRVDIGARVDTDTVLTTLDDISSIEIETRISEVLFPSVRNGAVVTAQSAAFPGRTFTGKVVAIDKRIDPVARAFQVRVRVPNKDGALPAGMFMRLALELGQRESAAIPEEALVVQGERRFVYVVNDAADRVSRSEVTIGQRRDGVVEITAGVQPGAVIVAQGTQRLKDGASIRIAPTDADSGPGAPRPTAELPTSKPDRKQRKGGG